MVIWKAASLRKTAKVYGLCSWCDFSSHRVAVLVWTSTRKVDRGEQCLLVAYDVSGSCIVHVSKSFKSARDRVFREREDEVKMMAKKSRSTESTAALAGRACPAEPQGPHYRT